MSEPEAPAVRAVESAAVTESYEWILPIGTHMVIRVEVRDSQGHLICPAGAVGTIAKASIDGTHSYRVLLPDGPTCAMTPNI